MNAPAVGRGVAANERLNEEARKQAIISDAKIKELDAGFGPSATYTDPATNQTFTGRPDKASGRIHNADTGEIVTGATKATAGQQASGSVKSVDGVPTYITRNGKDVYPGSPDFTDDDKKLLDAANDAYQKGEKAKQDRQERLQQAYAKMRGQVYQYGVIDKQTGDPVMVNADTINANPGRYGPAALTQQLKNRAAIFDEIDYTKNQFNDVLDKMSDEDYKALPSAQIALALKDRDPKSAVSQFFKSEEGKALSNAQVDYITGLLSLQESAMSLRTIAGMGQGSDKLRSAITSMLPDAGTPSKYYATRQMSLFEGELNQLRRPVPMDGKLGMGDGSGMTPPPSPKPKYKVGDSVMYKGAPHKVTGITPEGKLQLAP
jgi:hypothetical protein